MNALFAALADPTRRAVLEQLCEGMQPVTVLAEPHAMALPSFLRHIEVLEHAGLVATSKQGRARMVALRPKAFGELEDWLAAQKQLWNGHLTRLEIQARRLELAGTPMRGARTP